LIADAKRTFISQIPESLKEDLVKRLQSFSQEKRHSSAVLGNSTGNWGFFFFFWFFIYLCGVFVSQFGWLHDHNFSAMIFLQSLDFVAGGAWCIICITNWCIDIDASSWDHSWVSVVACIFEQLLAVTRGHYLVFFILNCGNMLYW
jgi:hypothetical protein